MFDLYPCRLGSLTNLGHCAYALRPCPQCAGAYAACTVCPSLGALCPGCVHRERLAAIGRGEVVFPEIQRIDEKPHPESSDPHNENTHPNLDTQWCASEGSDQAGELAHVTDQAVPLDAGHDAVYSAVADQQVIAVATPDQQVIAVATVDHVSPSAPSVGALPVDTPTSPLVLLVLPVDLAGVPPVLQALAAVIASQVTNGPHNGHVEAGGQRLPRHLAQKCYLSDTPCPSGHTYTDTGKVLRYHGNNQCVPCSGQRKPRPKAAATAATEG